MSSLCGSCFLFFAPSRETRLSNHVSGFPQPYLNLTHYSPDGALVASVWAWYFPKFVSGGFFHLVSVFPILALPTVRFSDINVRSE